MASPSPQGQVGTAFDSWSSPITADLVSASIKHPGGMAVDSQGRLIWCETHPWEGRYVLMREGVEPGKPAEAITPEGYNVRTVIHECGGGPSTVWCDILVFF
ncbi:hypothetical protein R1sor_026258 [Riccia sorocarpa]|uniref:SMP-30/Gluconolactonase/LRE-like region domain-containing protein n=1 Tax=Riccia sorocarpa TaxID=122646 RepID=A0ABD3GDY4_9MARC